MLHLKFRKKFILFVLQAVKSIHVPKVDHNYKTYISNLSIVTQAFELITFLCFLLSCRPYEYDVIHLTLVNNDIITGACLNYRKVKYKLTIYK